MLPVISGSASASSMGVTPCGTRPDRVHAYPSCAAVMLHLPALPVTFHTPRSGLAVRTPRALRRVQRRSPASLQPQWGHYSAGPHGPP